MCYRVFSSIPRLHQADAPQTQREISPDTARSQGGGCPQQETTTFRSIILFNSNFPRRHILYPFSFFKKETSSEVPALGLTAKKQNRGRQGGSVS